MLRDLEDLRAFVAVVDCGGFAAAAQRMRTTATVVNRRVTRLEDALGTRLVTRSTRGAAPTDEGRAFHERCHALLHELDDACLEAGGSPDVAGLVRLTAPASLERLLVQPVVSHLLRQHPRLRFELLLSDQRVDMPSQNLDVAIRAGVLDDSSLVARRLARVPAVLAASPAYLKRQGTPRAPPDLSCHAVLEHAEATLAQLWPASEGVVPQPRQRVRINGFEALADLALAGAGLCLAPEVQLARALADGRLMRVLAKLPLADVPLWAVFPASRHPTRRLRLLVDTLASYAARPFEHWGEPLVEATR